MILITSILCYCVLLQEPQKAPNCDEVASLVQSALEVNEPVAVEELPGGNSGNPLFLATRGENRYIVRFFKSSAEAHHEIACQRAASDAGYGPHVFAADPEQRYLIMEYVEPMTSDRYRALGTTLSKMHHGDAFPTHEADIFARIHTDIDKLKKKESFGFIAVHLEQMMLKVEEAIPASEQKAPCHNDLHPGNMIYSSGVYKIIDFGDAIQDDPYFDLATVIVHNCFNQTQEEAVLSSYFGRSILPEEKAKLTLMKQAVYICYAARNFLASNQPYDQNQESKFADQTFAQLIERFFWSGDDQDKEEIQPLSGYIFYREAVNHFQCRS